MPGPAPAPEDGGWAAVRTRRGRWRRAQGALVALLAVGGLLAALVTAATQAPGAASAAGTASEGTTSEGTSGEGTAGSAADGGTADAADPPGLAAADRAAAARRLVGAVALDPRGHRAGGCVALAGGAAPGRRPATVVLDAGHGDPDPGASGRTTDGRRVEEADVVLAVTLVVADRLRADGVRVVLTRAGPAIGARLAPGQIGDGALSIDGLRAALGARARCANLARADALVSIHLNAAEDPDARGAETLFDPNRPFSGANRALAGVLHRSVLDAFARAGRPTPDLGVDGDGSGEARGDLVLLAPPSTRVREPSLVPGALVEPLFLSRREDATFAASRAGRDLLAAAIADGVGRFLDGPAP